MTLGNAFGVLLNRGRLGLNPVTFAFDRVCQGISRSLHVYKHARVAVLHKMGRRVRSNDFEGSIAFKRGVAQEFRTRNRLHPMFYLSVEWDPRMGGHFKGGDPQSLSEEDFFHPERIKACETKYSQFVSSHLTKMLLVDADDVNNKLLRHLVTELFGNTVLRPVYMLFTPLTLMGWIKMGLSWGAQAPPPQNQAAPAAASADNAADDATSSKATTAVASVKAESAVVDTTASSRPAGFPEDAAWDNYRPNIGEKEAAELLKSEPDGAFVIIGLNGKELFSVVSIYSPVSGGDGSAAPVPSKSPLSAILGTRRLYHIPFVGYTTSPAGFQICIISSDEYFPHSDPPPAAVALLNGSMYLSLRQLLNAAYSILKANYVLSTSTAQSSKPLLNPREVEAENISSPASEEKKDVAVADGSDAARASDADGCNEFLDGGKLSERDSDDEDSDSSEDQQREMAPSADGESDEAVALFMQQERLVLIYELQGAIDEFKDVVDHIRKNSSNNKSGVPLNIQNDPTAIKALRRFLLCLEDVIYHGFKVRPEDAIQALNNSRQVRNSSNDTGCYESESNRKHDSDSKQKPGTFSTLFRAMSSKRDVTETKPTNSAVKDLVSAKTDFRSACAGEYNEDLIRFLESRFCTQWFWMESYRYRSDSGVGTSAQSGNAAGQSSGDSDKLHAFTTSLKRIASVSRRDDLYPVMVLNRLNSAWLDLGSHGIMISLEDCFDVLEERGVDDMHMYSLNKPLDRNCLRAFLYDSLIQGTLFEKIKRISNLATNEGLVNERKAGQELVFGHLFSSHLARGMWGSHAIFMNSAEHDRLLDLMASIDGISVVLPAISGASDDSKNVFDGVMKSIRSVNASVFNSSSGNESSTPAVKSTDSSSNDFGMSTFDALHLPTLKKKSGNHELTSRLRARRSSVDEAWAEHKAEFEQSGALDAFLSLDPKRILQLRKKQIRSIESSDSDRTVDDSFESRLRALSSTNIQVAGSPGKAKGSEASPLPSTDGDTLPMKPPPLVKRMSEPSNLSAIRRKESAFKLEMLLNGRTPLSTLASANIWEPAGYRLSVDIKRIEVDEDKSKLIPISAGPQVVIYQLCVNSDRLYPDPTDLTDDGKVKDTDTVTWIVRKRYSDFDDLHKQLKSGVGSKLMNGFQLPQKQFINVGNMGGSNFQFVEKRRQGLQDYLDNVLQQLPYCKEVRSFLARSIEERAAKILTQDSGEDEESGSRLSVSEESLSSKLVDRPISAIMDAIKIKKFAKDKDATSGGGAAPTKSSKATVLPAQEEGEGTAEAQEPDATEGGSSSSENPRGVASAGLDSRTMRILEVRVYDLLREVLDFDTMNVVRRKLVAIAHTSITVLFSGTLKEWASAQAKGAVSDASLVWLLEWVLNIVWPNGVLLTRVPNRVFHPTDPIVVEQELLKLHAFNLDGILAKLPAALLSNSLGDGQAEKAVALLLSLLENPFVLKSLMYILLDMLFMEMFPEMRPFLSGMEVLR